MPGGPQAPGLAPARASRALLWSVALLSAGAIVLEIAYIRLFSAALGHDLASMIISLALLGIGAAGSLLAIAGERATHSLDRLYPLAALGFGVAGVACALWGLSFEIMPEAFAWEPDRLAGLAGLYLLLAVPFFFSGGAIGLALAAFRDSLGRIYRADLAGAGVGGCLALAGSYWLAPGWAVAMACAAGFGAAVIQAAFGGGRRRLPVLAGIVAMIVVLAVPALRPEPHFSTYRDLGRVLLRPGAEKVAEAWDPLGLVTAVRSPEIPVRFAPGMSLLCPHPIPRQLGLYLDGNGHGAVTNAEAGLPDFLKCLPTAAPHRLRPAAKTLVLNASGGLAALQALEGGASRVDMVEPLARLREMIAGPLAGIAGPLSEGGRVRLLSGMARAHVERSDERYGVIRVVFGGPHGPGLSIGEDYLRTVEGFMALLDRLEPDGVLCFSRPVEGLPSASVRLVSLLVATLEKQYGAGAAADRIAMFRGPFTVTLLACKRPFEEAEVGLLREFAAEQNLDLVWLPGMSRDEANRRSMLESPIYHDTVRALLGPGRQAFMAGHAYDITPPHDEAPYFPALFRWDSAREFFGDRTRGTMGLIQWSWLLIPLTLVQALAAGAVFILAPLVVAGRGREAAESMRNTRAAWFALYFLCLGLGYLLLEVLAIKRLTLFMGGPVQAAAAILGPFLVFSGIGAGLAQRWVNDSRVRIRAVVGLFVLGALLSTLLVFGVAGHLEALIGLPVWSRAVIAAGLIAPLAVCLGIPFPLGLALVSRTSPRWTLWAFGVNGCASVAGPLVGTWLAVETGFAWAAALGAGLYPLAWACLWGGIRKQA